MKKFMTDIKTMAALLIAGAAFTACSSSDDNIIDEQPVNPAQKTYTLTVNASKGDGATTRALDLTGKTLTASWATTENVYVKKESTWATGSLQPEADGTTATLKGSLTGISIEANDNLTLQFPKSGDITYAGQQGTIADIQANFDWATATVDVESVSPSGNINPKAATTTFTNQQAIIKFTLKDKANDAAISPSALTVSDGTSTVELTSIPGTTYSDPKNGAGVLYVAFPAAGEAKTITLTATVGDDTYTYETASDKTFVNGQYYEITVKMTKQAAVPEGALSGEFSVSDTKTVYFSKGNLRYASGTWSFFDNQYDYYTSYSADAWDKFGWSTAATTYGMSTSTSSSDYSGDFVDWGATMGTGWFTLSSAEWTYLFNTRSASTVGGTANGRYAKAKVNNVQGMILFPDTYTHPDGVTAPTGVNATGDTGWNGNNYSSEDWTKMESAGCVFLPAAGHREGSAVGNADASGNYWSAMSYDANRAYNVSFTSGSLSHAGISRRFYGYSVRLVRQVTE